MDTDDNDDYWSTRRPRARPADAPRVTPSIPRIPPPSAPSARGAAPSRRWLIVLVAAVIFGAGVAGLVARSSAGGDSSTSGVGLDHSPTSCTPATCVQNVLSGVSCATATFCVAVGGHYFANSAGFADEQTLVEMWNGTSWTIAKAPNPVVGERSLLGVSCPTTTFCVAVGQTVVSPDSGELYDQIIETWNGQRWTLLHGDETGFTDLNAVTCVNTSRCVAVGKLVPKDAGLRPLIETWNGTTWTTSASPSENPDDLLNAVSCRDRALCFAVGKNFSIGTSHYGEATSIERLIGSSWSVASSLSPSAPGNDILNGVSCQFASSCFAVGDFNTNAFSGSGYRTLIEKWNATSWLRSITPSIHEPDVQLNGVDCASARLCFAVGFQTTTTNGYSLIEKWNGSDWAAIKSPRADALGTGTVQLNGVSCVSASQCIAVGYYPHEQGTAQSLVERWNGKTWTEVVAPNVDG